MVRADAGVDGTVRLSRWGTSNGAATPCLMEVVSEAAGEERTDHPACTNPLLAALGRWVNDRVTDDARQDLYRVAPLMVGVRGPDTEVATILISLCAELRADLNPDSPVTENDCADNIASRLRARFCGRPGTARERLEAIFFDVQREMTGLEQAAVDELWSGLLVQAVLACRLASAHSQDGAPRPRDGGRPQRTDDIGRRHGPNDSSSTVAATRLVGAL